jgi:hypothetical protein
MSLIVPILTALSLLALAVLVMAARDDKQRAQRLADQQWKDVEGE